MNLDQFIAKYNGQTKGYPTDNQYWGECLSIVKLYIKEVFGIDPPSSGVNAAYGYWTNFPAPLSSTFEKIENTVSGIPQKGDIIIWNSAVGNGCGHISIFIDGNASSFRSFDQNWGGKQAHIQGHYYNNVLGWLHPKVSQGVNMLSQGDVNDRTFGFNGMGLLWVKTEWIGVDGNDKSRPFPNTLFQAIKELPNTELDKCIVAKQDLIQGSIEKQAMINALTEENKDLKEANKTCHLLVDEADDEKEKALDKLDVCTTDLKTFQNATQGIIEPSWYQRFVSWLYKLIRK